MLLNAFCIHLSNHKLLKQSFKNRSFLGHLKCDWALFICYLIYNHSLSKYLILPLAGWVVQVGVAPVVADSLFGLLVHPVELVGAALHVVTQGQQVLLSGCGVGLEGWRWG